MFPFVCDGLGDPATFDAAQVGSYAHRLRSYWTNLAPAKTIETVLSRVVRDPNQTVHDILDEGRMSRVVERSDRPPYYPANIRDPMGVRPRGALPTLMAHPHSYAFRADGPGTLYDANTGMVCQPNAAERERAMGFATGSTAAPGVSEAHRFSALGQAMDGFAMTSILAVAIELTCSIRGGALERQIESDAMRSPLPPTYTHLNIMAIQANVGDEQGNGPNLGTFGKIKSPSGS